MKIKPAHLQHMRDAIAATMAKHGPEKLAAYRAQLASDPRVKDIDKRYRWDLFQAAGLGRYSCDVLYAYLDDAHIDTAIRSIVKGSAP